MPTVSLFSFLVFMLFTFLAFFIFIMDRTSSIMLIKSGRGPYLLLNLRGKLSVFLLLTMNLWAFVTLSYTSSLCFGYGLIIRDTVCKYFLPLHRLPFQSVHCFLCCAETFSLMQFSLAIFAFLQLALLVSYLRSHCVD